MKKVIVLLMSMLVVLALVACGNTNTDTDTNKDTNTNTDTENVVKPNDTDSSSGGGNQDTESDEPVEPGPSTDYESTTVKDSLKDELEVFDGEDTFGNEGEVLDYTTNNNIDVSKYPNRQILIDKAGTYRIYGTSSDGQIYVKATDKNVVLVLDGVSLTSGNSTGGPAIYAEDCASVTIVLAEGSENYLSDVETNDGEGAVLRVRSCNLTIEGKGKLTIDAKAKNAIANTKELTINGGEFNLTAPGHGIYGKRGLTINGGKFDIDAGKSGFKSGDVGETSNEYGFINVTSGSINIECVTNGFNCTGPVTISGGRIEVDAETGNAIDAYNDVTINGGISILNSYKSAISAANIKIEGSANIKISTTGNGFSATDVSISTSGVIYAETAPTYEKVDENTSADKTRYVYKDGAYVLYDEATDGKNATQYVLRDCKGIKADSVSISKGIIGIDSYQDSINITNTASFTGGRVVLFSKNDAIEATDINLSNKADVTVLGAEKGTNSKNITISGGMLYVIAEKDALNANATLINGGTVYLLDKVDTGTDGTITVNGGTLLMITTTNKPQETQGEAKYVSGLVMNKDDALAGNWVKVISGEDVVKVELPKNYNEKMAIYYSSSTMGSDLVVTIGTVDENDVFTVIKTETIGN